MAVSNGRLVPKSLHGKMGGNHHFHPSIKKNWLFLSSGAYLYTFGWWAASFIFIFTMEKWLGGFLKTGVFFLGAPPTSINHQNHQNHQLSNRPKAQGQPQPSYEGYCHSRIGSFISIRLKKVRQVKNPTTTKKEKDPRIWLGMTLVNPGYFVRELYYVPSYTQFFWWKTIPCLFDPFTSA